MLDHCCPFQFNFLCRPAVDASSISSSRTSDSRPRHAHISPQARYCVDYEYYAEDHQTAHRRPGLAEIEYDEFRDLLEKIDQTSIVSRHSTLSLASADAALAALH